MQRLHTIFLSFFKIGLFTFGGGYAMLPLIERELIAKRKWIIENYDPYLDGKVGHRMLEAARDYIARHGVPAKRKLNLWRKYTSIKKFGKIKRA